MTMPVCQAAIDLVKQFEGLYLKAYLCPAGVPTIGYGHTKGITQADVQNGLTITEAQATAYLTQDLQQSADSVSALVHVPLAAEQLGALTSFQFNTGALGQSTLLTLLNKGDYVGAANQFPRWVKATVNGQKVTLPGLVRRRAAEQALFNSAPAPMPQAVEEDTTVS